MPTDPMTLTFWLGNYANVTPLKKGVVTSDIVKFDFPEVQVANRGFKSIVRDAKYDVGELAIGT